MVNNKFTKRNGRKIMKKLLALLLALVMILSLVACGTSTENDGDKNSSNPTTNSTTPTGTNPTGATNPTNSNNSAANDNGYETAVKLFAEVQHFGSSDKIESLAPAAYWSYQESKSFKAELLQSAKYAADAYYTNNKNQFGDDFTLNVAIANKTDYTASEVTAIANLLKTQYNIDAATVTAACKLTAQLTFAGTEPGTDEMNFSVVKIGDTWYCVDYAVSYISFAIEELAFGG